MAFVYGLIANARAIAFHIPSGLDREHGARKSPQRKADIIASRTPAVGAAFHREMAGIALSFRNYSLEKPPSVSERIDFANALQLLGASHVTEEHRDVLLPFLAKTEKDRRR